MKRRRFRNVRDHRRKALKSKSSQFETVVPVDVLSVFLTNRELADLAECCHELRHVGFRLLAPRVVWCSSDVEELPADSLPLIRKVSAFSRRNEKRKEKEKK